jgi:hypothetical protein
LTSWGKIQQRIGAQYAAKLLAPPAPEIFQALGLRRTAFGLMPFVAGKLWQNYLKSG